MSFTVHEDAWLGEVMRRKVFRVEGSGDAAEFRRHLTANNGFHFAKIPTDRVADLSTLGRVGMFVVDTNVNFELTREIEHATSLDVGEIREGEADAVLEIAGSAFRYSRFHLDPAVGLELANHVKREWIRNYVLRKRGDTLLVARDGGVPIGFLAPIVAHGTAVIDLVAVATAAHGRGAGSALCAAFANRYRGMPRIVGTQVANVPSIRLYTKLGFQLAKSSYVLHLHR
ncbi:MAG: GNAT family N-acetyltransferase [Myxococcota bacterium]|nr:GNAT family N-acetyltransferase [Deltaproteobacteria bacterium]MDQ3336701.1 GNAT family N-acetyltransferase [Myxococcota bacterium]